MAFINGKEVLFNAKVNIGEGNPDATGGMPFPPSDILCGDGYQVFPAVEDTTEEVTYLVASDEAIREHVVKRDEDGDIALPTQDVDFITEGNKYAVSGETVRNFLAPHLEMLGDVNTDIAELFRRVGDIDSALDEVIALQDYYTGATFDELHEYAEEVKQGGAE